jgi:hypothetical protein
MKDVKLNIMQVNLRPYASLSPQKTEDRRFVVGKVALEMVFLFR